MTDFQVKNAKPKDKPYKMFDGGRMYIEVMPTGSKIARLKYRQANGKENTLTFGRYPEMTLATAREKRSSARRLLLEGVDPAEHRNDAKRIAAERASGVARQNRIILGGARRFVFSRQKIPASFITGNFGTPAPSNIGFHVTNGRLETFYDSNRK